MRWRVDGGLDYREARSLAMTCLKQILDSPYTMLALEFLVFAIIASEALAKYLHDHRMKMRVNEILPFIESGHELLKAVPDPSYPDAVLTSGWIDQTRDLTVKVSAVLDIHSSRAKAAFEQVRDSGVTAQMIYNSDGSSFSISGEVRLAYQVLASRLDNLNRIAEKPEAYFR